MKKYLLIIPITIALAIFFYPTTSNSNATGSVGGKTGSPADGGNDCRGCHTDAQQGQGATITTDIPSTGYIAGNTYNITAKILVGAALQDPKGFEVTCEENTTNTKAGVFGTPDLINTQFTNNSNAVTHTAAGNSQNTWDFTWEAPIAGTGDITFYGAFIEAMSPIGNNQGDLFNEATLTFNESPPISTSNFSCEQGNCISDDFGQYTTLADCEADCGVTTINNMSSKNQIIFNSITKTVESLDKKEISVYSLEGKLVLSSNKKYTSLSHLSNGIYIIKSENKNQKIILN